MGNLFPGMSGENTIIAMVPLEPVITDARKLHFIKIIEKCCLESQN